MPHVNLRTHRNVCEKEKEAATQYQVARIYLFIIVPVSAPLQRNSPLAFIRSLINNIENRNSRLSTTIAHAIESSVIQ